MTRNSRGTRTPCRVLCRVGAILSLRARDASTGDVDTSSTWPLDGLVPLAVAVIRPWPRYELPSLGDSKE